jgi:hypothetical protein
VFQGQRLWPTHEAVPMKSVVDWSIPQLLLGSLGNR